MSITGGSVTKAGDWNYVEFTASGTATVATNVEVEYVVVGGGGGGGGNGYNNPASGGGGGGQVVWGTATFSAGDIAITVGAGGAGGAAYGASNEPGAYAGGTGEASIIAGYATAIGGGGGGGDNEGAIPDTQGPTAGAGGGGGSTGSTATGATGSVSSGGDASGNTAGGGGGAAPDDGTDAGSGSDGGAGIYIDDFAQFGDSGYFAGGGGGGLSGQGVGAGPGGVGGGGGGVTQTAGADGTGGGGSGRRYIQFHNAQSGAAGGDGVVLLRYQAPTPPDEDAGWWVEVWDLDNTQRLMDDDPPAMDVQFEKVLSDIGAGRVTFPSSWSRIAEVCDPPNDVTTLIKVYVAGTFKYAFRADQIERVYQEDSASLTTVSGAGYEVIVDDGDIPAFDYPTNPSLSGDWVYGFTEIYSQDFEADTLDGWTGFNFSGSGGTDGALSTDIARSGTASVEFTTGAVDLSPDSMAFYRTFNTEPGRTYKATGYANGTGDYFWFARDLEAPGAADFSAESSIGVGGTVTGSGGTAWDLVTGTFTAPSATTRFAFIADTLNHSFYLDDITVEEGADGASIGAIVNDILVATQAQGNSTALTDSFSDSVDSDGSAWAPATLAVTVGDGPPFGTLLDRATGLGYEWRVVPAAGDEGYQLDLFNPGNLGTDYTDLSTAPVARQGATVFGGKSRQHVAKNVVRVTTAEGYWAEATDASSTAAIGRRVESIQNSRTYGTAIAQELADARLAAHQAQTQAAWLEFSEASTDIIPFVDFDVGDTIKLELLDVLGVDGWFRVHSIRADLTGEGNDMRYSVEFRP